MDLHHIGNGVTSSSSQEEQSTTSAPSSSVSPEARQQCQQPSQQHSQPYNLSPPASSSLPQTSYSPTVNLAPISTHTTSQYLDGSDEEVGSSSWSRSCNLQPQLQSQQSNAERETTDRHLDTGSIGRIADDPIHSTSDFVKKLYKILEDPSVQDVVSWGPLGDCFVVKDVNEFSKCLLPRLFRHSNFASFVRQLNKYDFHKVKNMDDNMFGEQSWAFRHPDFHENRKEALENIKRKVSAQRKSRNVPNTTTTSLCSNNNNSPSIHTTTSSSYPRRSSSPPQSYTTTIPTSYLKQEISDLKSRSICLESNFETRLSNLESNYETRLNHLRSSFESRLRSLEMGYESRLKGLENHYESVLVELVAFQRGVAQQDGVLKSLIRFFVAEDSERSKQRSSTMMAANQDLTTKTTAGLFLPSAPASTSSVPTEDGVRQYQRRQSHDQNQTPSLPFSQSRSQPASEAPSLSLSDCRLFLPQDTVQRILGSTSITTSAPSTPTTTRSGNGSSGWRVRAESDDTMNDVDRSESGTSSQNQGQQKMTHLEAVAQIMEYHLEGLDKSMGRKTGADVFGGERIVDRSRDKDQDGDERRNRRRDSDAELELGNRHGVGKACPSSSQQQQTLRQPTASSSSTSASLSTSTITSAKVNTEEEEELGNFTYDLASLSSETGNEDEDVEIVPPEMLTTGTSTSISSPKISTTSASSSSFPPSSPSSSQQKIRIRRATFVPGWTVPPRVLLVDDDAVTRKLSGKFLEIFGCTTDVAIDGIGAVTKMNVEKYDLVLMDILMPKLDGISATNLIRKFDRGTPIISMTVNSKPSEIMEYYSSGMNDILPKPFTKEGLLNMLEKHLLHLKGMQQRTAIPRSVGVPPLSDANFEQVLMTNAVMVQQQQQIQRHSATAAAGLLVSGNTADADSITNTFFSLPISPQQQSVSPSEFNFTSLSAMQEEDERINNPLAGMGLSDEQYNMILQNLVNGENFMGMVMDSVVGGGGNASGVEGSGGTKRSFDDDEFESNERGGKRGRFEMIE